jgi:hypothetical protein
MDYAIGVVNVRNLTIIKNILDDWSQEHPQQ